MNLEEIKNIRRKIYATHFLMIWALITTAITGYMVNVPCAIALAIPQILALAIFSPRKLVDLIDSCWAVYRVNKDMF